MGRILSTQFSVAVVLQTILAINLLLAPGSAQQNVTTWHNDNLRTGQNTNETTLTPSNLGTQNHSGFGQLCHYGLDGQVYAQPLVMTNVTLNGTTYPSVVYVVTMRNTLYVFSGAPSNGNCVLIKSLDLNPTQPVQQYPVDCRHIGSTDCKFLNPYVGVLGTPAIRPVTTVGKLYAVTETQDVPMDRIARTMVRVRFTYSALTGSVSS
jgi:hypothetical protein